MQSHDQIVEERAKRRDVRAEVERLEREIEALWVEEAESRAAAWDAGELRGIRAQEALQSARSAE